MSVAIESMSLRTFSACPSSRLAKTPEILVKPSMTVAIGSPNSSRMKSSENSVSSTTSWRSAAATERSSKPMSRATMTATSRGWVM